MGATPPLWIPAFTGMTSARGRNDEAGAGGIQTYLRPRNTIFVPIAYAGWRRHTQGMKIGLRWLVEVSWVSLVPPLDSGFRRTDECGAGGIQALLRLRNIIFVPIAHAGRRRHTKV